MARLVRALLAVAVLVGAGCGGGDESPAPTAPAPRHGETGTGPPPRPGPRMRVETIATGLEVPWDIAFLPGGRALVTERPGRIRLVQADGRLQRHPVAVVETHAVEEGGLLGIALDPDFPRHPFAYVYVTRPGRNEVERLRWRDGRLVPDGVVLDSIAAGPVHDAGRLRFGPDRRLYLPTGEAGNGELAQDPASLNGKFLRLTLAQARSSTDRPEVIARGLRNSQGFDWEPGTGRLIANDHGPSGDDGPQGFDEIDVIHRGGNYGWPLVYGNADRRFDRPLRVYRRAIAPSGAAFVRAPGTAWTGDYVLAALLGEQLRRLRIDGDRVVEDQPLLEGRFGRFRAIVQAPDGTLWVTTSNRDGRGVVRAGDDRILRITPPRG